MTSPDEHGVRAEDLVAYAEGRLPRGSPLHTRVEAHLREHPDSAARVHGYRRQDALIHQAFDRIAEEPLPARLLPDPSPAGRGRWRAASGLAAALVIGIAAGWTAARLLPVSPDQPAIQGFVERVAERLAQSPDVTIRSDEAVGTIADGNGPNLEPAGLQLIGGASGSDVETGVYRFDYRDRIGNTIHLFVARDIAPASSSIRTMSVNGRLLAYWHLGDSTYVLGGRIDRDRLIEIARTVRETLGKPPKRVDVDVTPGHDRQGDMIAVTPRATRGDPSRGHTGGNTVDGPERIPIIPERM